MANKKFTPEEMAILKANPYVLEVTEDIIHELGCSCLPTIFSYELDLLLFKKRFLLCI